MFLKTPDHIPAWMRPTYLLLSVTLGAMLGFLVATILILELTKANGSETIMNNWQYVAIVLGAVAGFFQGRVWWRWVYVERRWSRKK